MMFTKIEQIQQKRLAKNHAPLYTIEVTNEATQETIEIGIYAVTEEDAILLAKRISKRSERSLVKDLNFDIREIKDNKLGLFLPWKDPVNIRSVNDAVKMPLKRSKNLLKNIFEAAKGKNIIHLDELDERQLENLKTACMKSNYVSLILLMIAVYIYALGSGDNINYWSIALCITVAITSYIKTRTTYSLIKQVEIQRNYIETANYE